MRALVRNTWSSSKWTTTKYTTLMNCSLVCLARHSVNEAQHAATFESCDFEGNHLVVKWTLKVRVRPFLSAQSSWKFGDIWGEFKKWFASIWGETFHDLLSFGASFFLPKAFLMGSAVFSNSWEYQSAHESIRFPLTKCNKKNIFL